MHGASLDTYENDASNLGDKVFNSDRSPVVPMTHIGVALKWHPIASPWLSDAGCISTLTIRQGVSGKADSNPLRNQTDLGNWLGSMHYIDK